MAVFARPLSDQNAGGFEVGEVEGVLTEPGERGLRDVTGGFPAWSAIAYARN